MNPSQAPAPPTLADWRARVERELAGQKREQLLTSSLPGGLLVEALYTEGPAPGPVGASPFLRGHRVAPARWEARQRVDASLIGDARRDLAREEGVDGLTLTLQDGVRRGVMVHNADDLDRLLDGLDPSAVALHLDAGRGSLPAATWLLGWLDGVAAPRGGLGLDPLALLADQGVLAVEPGALYAAAAELAREAAARGGDLRALRVDGAPWSDAGADPVTELAAMLSGGVAALRGLEAAGLPPSEALPQIELSLRPGCELVLEVARVRALRALWARVAEACGAEHPRTRLHVELAARTLTRRDPQVNLLRNTLACVAGALAGADAITSTPFDAALGQPSELGRRVARNTHHLLAEEAHLHEVIDPMGGSWAVESLTEQLCARAWQAFRELEAEGGLLAVLRSGSLARRVEASRAATRDALRRRAQPVTGVSEFPALDEVLAERPPASADRPGDAQRFDALTRALAQPGALARALSGERVAPLHPEAEPALRVQPFSLHRHAEEFEALRDDSDARLRATGRRPGAFLALPGGQAASSARLVWTRGALEAGGLEAVEGPHEADDDAIVAAFAASGLPLAVICAPDAVYAERAPALGRALRAAGARAVLLAGRPGALAEALAAAGAGPFLHVGVDLVELHQTLREALDP